MYDNTFIDKSIKISRLMIRRRIRTPRPAITCFLVNRTVTFHIFHSNTREKFSITDAIAVLCLVYWISCTNETIS